LIQGLPNTVSTVGSVQEGGDMAGATAQIVVEPGSGRVVSLAGNQVTFKIQGDQTSGALSSVEYVMRPGMFVPPHLHEKADEVGYILEGELGAMVAEEEFKAGPGAFVVRPRGVPHALWNITDRPVKILDIYTPAGLEAFYDELARLLSATEPPTLEQMFEAGRRYDTIYLPELAPALMQKYGLRMPGTST
jgi:mannose-6-phosphate isomerase-like protein (cupin superfamily)